MSERAVSTTMGYVLVLVISSLLISGLVVAGGDYVESQRDQVAREELRVVGNQLAGGIADADRLANTSDGGKIRVNAWLPRSVVGGPYSIRIVSEPGYDGTNETTVVVSSDVADVSRNVTFYTSHEVEERTIGGGPVVVIFENADGDSARELVVSNDRPLSPETDPDAGPSEISRDEVVYVRDGGGLESVDSDGDVTQYGVQAEAIGPKEVDFDGDGLGEVPYVTSAGAVKLVDSNGETQTIATGAATSKTKLAVAEHDGEFVVFYVGAAEGDIFKASLELDPTEITGYGGYAAGAVVGVMDADADGDDEIVYTGTSQQIRYLNDSGDYTPSNGGAGQNNGIGVGSPRDFDGDGVPKIPMVDGSNTVHTYDIRSESKGSSVASNGAASPLTGIEWDTGASGLEVVYVNSTADTLYYVTPGQTPIEILDADGDPIVVDTSVGVA